MISGTSAPSAAPTPSMSMGGPPNQPFTPTTDIARVPVEESGITVEGRGPNVVPNIIRYGAPTAAGFLMPELSIPVLAAQALIAGGSEFAARRLEATEKDPELDTMFNDLIGSGAVGVMDMALGGAMRGVGAGMRAIGRRFLMPSTLPPEIRTALEVLGDVEPTKESSGVVKSFWRWLRQKPATRPFALTYGKLNAEESRFVNWLDGMARAGIGSRGVMHKFDVRNESALIDMVEQYVQQRATKATGPEFSVLTQRLLGKQGVYGEAFKPIIAYRKYLYDQFEERLKKIPATVDGTDLRNYIIESGDIEGGLPRSIYSKLRSDGLVPPLTTPSKTTKRITTTKASKVGTEDISKVEDITRTNLETGAEKRAYTGTEGTRDIANKSEIQTVRETEVIEGMTEEELVEAWRALTPYDANRIAKVINAGWKNGQDTRNNTLSHMGEKIENQLKKIIDRDDELALLHKTADSFFIKEVEITRSGAIKGLRKAFKEKPASVLAELGGGAKDIQYNQVYDKLVNIREMLYLSGEAAKKGREVGLKSAALAKLTPEMAQEYDKAVLQPIRYSLLTRHADQFGRLDPDGFLNMMKNNADVPEFFEEVFGGAKQVEAVQRMMTALSVQMKKTEDKNIFIQLFQAGAIGGMATAGAQAIFSHGDISIEKTGGAGAVGMGVGILLGPYALAKMLTNTNTIRMFTDGLEVGYRSGRFAMALRKLGEMEIGKHFFRDSPSEEAVNFYTTKPQQQ
jgi:hypothetical protein